MLPMPPLPLLDDIDAAGGRPVVTCPDRYDTVDIAGFTVSIGEAVSEVRLLNASALFCLFANAGICSSGLEDCVCNGGEMVVGGVVAAELFSVEEPRVWVKECLCGDVTERRLMERRRLPRSMLVAECEWR